jgi:hypothetical protein
VPKDKATIGNEAIRYAEQFLDDNGFAGEGGMYSSSRADWYSIGGRWSGELLTLQAWYPKVKEAIDKMMKEKYPTLESGVSGVWYGDKDKEALKASAVKDIKAIWEKKVPLGFKDCPPPDIRDSLLSVRSPNSKEALDGLVPSEQEDNAMICTKAMFKRLVERYRPSADSWGSVEIVDTEEMTEHTLSSIPEEKVVGNWIVVVDYHS